MFTAHRIYSEKYINTSNSNLRPHISQDSSNKAVHNIGKVYKILRDTYILTSNLTKETVAEELHKSSQTREVCILD